MRARLAKLFIWYREAHADGLRQCAGTDVLSEADLTALATLINAVEDGLSFERSMDDGLDHQRTLDLLGLLVSLYVREKAASNRA